LWERNLKLTDTIICIYKSISVCVCVVVVVVVVVVEVGWLKVKTHKSLHNTNTSVLSSG